MVDFWKCLFAQEVDLIRGHIQRLTSLSVWVSVLPVSCELGCRWWVRTKPDNGEGCVIVSLRLENIVSRYLLHS